MSRYTPGALENAIRDMIIDMFQDGIKIDLAGNSNEDENTENPHPRYSRNRLEEGRETGSRGRVKDPANDRRLKENRGDSEDDAA